MTKVFSIKHEVYSTSKCLFVSLGLTFQFKSQICNCYLFKETHHLFFANLYVLVYSRKFFQCSFVYLKSINHRFFPFTFIGIDIQIALPRLYCAQDQPLPLDARKYILGPLRFQYILVHNFFVDVHIFLGVKEVNITELREIDRSNKWGWFPNITELNSVIS